MRRFSVKWFSRYFIVYEPKICKMLFTAQHAIARSNEPCMHSWNPMLVHSTLIPFCITLSLLTWRYSRLYATNFLSHFFCKQRFQTKIRLCINFLECFPEKVLNVLPILGKRYMPLSIHTHQRTHAESGFRGISLFMNQKQTKRFSPHIKCQGRRNIFYLGGGGLYLKKVYRSF